MSEENGAPFDVSRYHRVRDTLSLMRMEDPQRRVWGASSHRYVLRPPASQTSVECFERQYKVRLPEDYRCFLQLFGDGGAGPGSTGLYPLCREDLTLNSAEQAPEFAVERIGGLWVQLGNHGCDGSDRLCVASNRYGEVWECWTEDDWFEPAGASFADWYLQWLDNLMQYSLPILCTEKRYAHLGPGMHRAQLEQVIGSRGRTRRYFFGTVLVFRDLVTEFELDNADRVIRRIEHGVPNRPPSQQPLLPSDSPRSDFAALDPDS